jgi:AcrR family transcriptional regulator
MKQQDKSRYTRTLILDAAAAQFAARGYAATSLHDIVSHTGMSKGALYSHFPSKPLLAAEFADRFLRDWKELLARADEARQSPLSTLRELVDGLAELTLNKAYFAAGRRLLWDEAHARHSVPEPQEQLLDTLFRLIRDSQEQSEIAPDHDPELLACLVMFLFVGFSDGADARECTDAEQRVRGLWDLVFPLLGPDPAVRG